MLLELFLKDVFYTNTIILLLSYTKSKQEKICSWANWLWQFQNGFYTINQNDNNLDKNFYNRGWKSKVSKIAFKILLDWKIGPSFGFSF